jgi:hypothetical protein
MGITSLSFRKRWGYVNGGDGVGGQRILNGKVQIVITHALMDLFGTFPPNRSIMRQFFMFKTAKEMVGCVEYQFPISLSIPGLFVDSKYLHRPYV